MATNTTPTTPHLPLPPKKKHTLHATHPTPPPKKNTPPTQKKTTILLLQRYEMQKCCFNTSNLYWCCCHLSHPLGSFHFLSLFSFSLFLPFVSVVLLVVYDIEQLLLLSLFSVLPTDQKAIHDGPS